MGQVEATLPSELVPSPISLMVDISKGKSVHPDLHSWTESPSSKLSLGISHICSKLGRSSRQRMTDARAAFQFLHAQGSENQS